MGTFRGESAYSVLVLATVLEVIMDKRESVDLAEENGVIAGVMLVGLFILSAIVIAVIYLR